ncbi:hypothetical protein GF402_01770 [Candidatus Fermentibacteria bacterium]|nr:hypothetical protein [Candidatus Fermentibacteria bacterium]
MVGKVFPAALLLLVCACVTFKLAPETSEITVWELGGGSERVSVGTIAKSLLVRDFAVDPTYDRTDMVRKWDDGRISMSSENRWVSTPGELLPDLLATDLLRDSTYRYVLRAPASALADVTVDGRVLSVGALNSQGSWTAVLEVGVSVYGTGGSPLLFQRLYRYTEPIPTGGYSEMASAVSSLVGRWSVEVRSDLSTVCGDD